MDNLRSTFVSRILSNIPPRVKPIDYLMEALDISRESVYRRIRGDISFTLEEIAKLSVELGFSIDELILKDMHSRMFFDLHTTPEQDPSEVFVTMFQMYFQGIFDVLHIKDVESTMALNHIPFGIVIFSNHLLKFSYYRWMHHNNHETSLKYFYSDVTLPEKITHLQYEAMENLKKIRSNTIIFGPDVFLNLIREIQYYYKRKLINENEFLLLRDDLSKLVDLVESIAQFGFFGSDAKYNLYLSSLNLESSSRFIRCGERVKSQFFVNSIEPLTNNNPLLCTIHKKWLDSMRKYATLITQSNEILQVRYFNKQRSHIKEITDTVNNISF